MSTITEILTEQQDWSLTSPTENFYSSDDMIDAYFKGKRDGVEEGRRLILDKLSSNIEKSGKNINKIFQYFKSNKINPIYGFLKVNSWEDFKILIVVGEEDYLSDNILNMYEYISEFENNIKDEFYNVSISIIDNSEYFDQDCVSSDGYIFKHKLSEN